MDVFSDVHFTLGLAMRGVFVILMASIIGLSGCTGIPLLAANLNPSRFKADADTRRLCEKDGGIRVSRTVPLEVGRFPTVIPEYENPREWIKSGVIYGKYRYEDTYTYQDLHGYTLYRHRTAITSISDNTVIGEMVYYLRQGEPGAPGITCPENLSNDKLINSVFTQDTAIPDPLPFCTQGKSEKVVLTSPTKYISKEHVPKISAREPDSNIVWQRGIGCDGQTKIDRWYDKTGEHSIGLVATRLLFFGKDGKLCQNRAMPDSEKIICDSTGISVVGYKRGLLGVGLVQRFNKVGELEVEAELMSTPPSLPSGQKLASYRESDDTIEFATSYSFYPNSSQCFIATFSKPKALVGTRIGPTNMDFGYSSCDAK